MEGEGRWSSEALQAMDTHLGLLQRASQCETAMVGGHGKTARLSGQCETDMGPRLDLNSHLPLPYGWEQFLDLQTGQVYYVDWKRCRRSYMDPRMLLSERKDDDDTDTSECISDAHNFHAPNMHDIVEVNTKFITSPMLQEDWNLMEVRGWMSLESDEFSEITSEATSPRHSLNVSRMDAHNSPKLVTKGKNLFSCESVCV